MNKIVVILCIAVCSKNIVAITNFIDMVFNRIIAVKMIIEEHDHPRSESRYSCKLQFSPLSAASP